MAINRISTNFRQRTDVIDSITPKPFVRKTWDGAVPAGEWKPAAWLPVQFTKSNINAGIDAFVISSGKVVAFDTQGRLVPAGLRMSLSGASALVYTQTDVDWGVIDLTTGLAVTAAVTYGAEEVGKALLGRGLVLEQTALDASATLPVTDDAEGLAIIELFISYPVGVVLYDVYKWAGTPEDGDQHFTNYSKQHLIQFATAHQMQVPHQTTEETGESVDASALTTETYAVATNNQIDAGDYWDATNVAQIERYSNVLTSASPVAAIGLEPDGAGIQFRVATNTDRTPVTCDDSTVLIRERTRVQDISKAGDWFLDGDVGALFVHDDTWTYLVGLATTVDFGYYYYEGPNSTANLATAHQHAHFADDVVPGDFVAYDGQSNFMKATTAQIAAGLEVVGRVLALQKQPRSLLDKVKTAWNFSGVAASAQMPGTATKGFTDLITLSGESVADQVVILDIRIR